MADEPKVISGRSAGLLWAGSVLGCLLAAATMWALIGPASLNGDVFNALAWGRELANGRLPDYTVGPTPHPLTNGVGALLAVLSPQGAYRAAQAGTYLAFGGLLVAVFHLGRLTSGATAGLVGVLLLATSYGLVYQAAQGFYDIPAHALAAFAAVVVIARPDRRVLGATLLTLAGLIRPEYWLIGVLWGLWLLRSRPRGWLVVAAVLAVAPVVWLVGDWVIAGSPAFSLTHTQDGAVEIGRTTGLANVPQAYVDNLRALVAPSTVVAGVLGAVLVLVVPILRRALLLVGVLVIGAATYLLIGVGDLPLIQRYLLPTAIALCALGGIAVSQLVEATRTATFTNAPRGVVGLSMALLLLASLPGRLDVMRTLPSVVTERRAAVDDLRVVATKAARRCGSVAIDPLPPRANVAQRLGVSQANVLSYGAGVPRVARIYPVADTARLVGANTRRSTVAPISRGGWRAVPSGC